MSFEPFLWKIHKILSILCLIFYFILFIPVENLEHCDFIALRNMLIRTHLQDLKEVTNSVHYENYRCRKLAGLGTDGKPGRISNK